MGALDATLGVTFIAVVLAAMLYGVSCVQLYSYFGKYRHDPLSLKTLVIAVWFFDTVHQILITHTVYSYLITHFGDVTELGKLLWSLIVEVLFNGLTALCVQCFFAVRVWRLSKNNVFLIIPVFLLIFGEFACVVVYVVKALQLNTFAQLAELKPLSMVVNAVAAAGDVLIAMILCSMLHFSRTGFKRSDSIINKLIITSVNTGLITSICAVLSLATIAAFPDTFIYICFYFVLGRLYNNSLLATLNARSSLRNSKSCGDAFSVDLRDLRSASGSDQAVTGPTNSISVRIETTKEMARDEESAHEYVPSDKI